MSLRNKDHRHRAKQRRRVSAALQQARVQVLTDLYERGCRLEAIGHSDRAMWRGEPTPFRVQPAGITIAFSRVHYRWAQIMTGNRTYDQKATEAQVDKAAVEIGRYMLANGMLYTHMLPNPSCRELVCEYYGYLGKEQGWTFPESPPTLDG